VLGKLKIFINKNKFVKEKANLSCHHVGKTSVAKEMVRVNFFINISLI